MRTYKHVVVPGRANQPTPMLICKIKKKMQRNKLMETGFFTFLTTKRNINKTREGFLRKNIVAVSFFQNCAIHPYS